MWWVEKETLSTCGWDGTGGGWMVGWLHDGRKEGQILDEWLCVSHTDEGKARQGKFIYIALFIHEADSKCFTLKHLKKVQCF